MAVIADFGTYGVWRSAPQLDAAFAAEVERLGYGALWIGGSPSGDLAIVDEVLGATRRIVVATGIVNVWRDDAATVAESFQRIEARHPGRFVLGIGSGHKEATAERVRPLATMRRYLDVLDEGGVPAESRLLAALGPRTLELARDRSLGAHPYLTTPEHTARARAVLGEALLAPDQKVAIAPTIEEARETARRFLARYLQMSNYVRMLLESGFTDADVAGSGSDRLVDAVATGHTVEAAVARVDAHLHAGADHVAVQALGRDALGSLARLAEGFGLDGARTTPA